MAIGSFKQAKTKVTGVPVMAGTKPTSNVGVASGVSASAGQTVVPGLNASTNAAASGANVGKPQAAVANAQPSSFANAMGGGLYSRKAMLTANGAMPPAPQVAGAQIMGNTMPGAVAAGAGPMPPASAVLTPAQAAQLPQHGDIGAAASGASGENAAGSPIMDTNKLYQDMLGQQDQMWADQQQALQGEMAGFQREADSLNARMGGSIAGGYAGLAGSALGSGMKAYNQAAQDYQTNRLNTMAKWAESQQDQARFDKTNQLDTLRLNLDNPDQAEYINNYMNAEAGAEPAKTALVKEREANIQNWSAELDQIMSQVGKSAVDQDRINWLKAHIERAKKDIETNAGRH